MKNFLKDRMTKVYHFNGHLTRPMLSPRELLKEYPLSIKQMRFVEKSREIIRNILNGVDNRLLLIIGPCSIHDRQATIEYAKKLAALAEAVSDSFFIVMRLYYEKPRTTTGWKGMLYDPHLDGSNDINGGLRLTRSILSEATDMEIPVAAEILEPSSVHYFGDLITWGCVGARTTTSQIHRQAASGLTMPIAFKNNTDGNIEVAVQSVMTAKEPHTYHGINDTGCPAIIQTEGNSDCHICLRGGETVTNYDRQSVEKALELLKSAGLTQRVIIDCSHDNSKRIFQKQPDIFHEVVEQVLEGNNSIKGIIMESHLFSGNQEIPENLASLKYGVSITDPCLDWATASNLILNANKRLIQNRQEVLAWNQPSCP
jgi:3-deoxy-7-phosphoheptulonate synthase